MTPIVEALHRVLDDIAHLTIEEQTGIAVAVLAGTLASRSDCEWALENMERHLRADIARIEELRTTPYPKANGNGKGNFLGANGTEGS
jgi:hypothetical protein